LISVRSFIFLQAIVEKHGVGGFYDPLCHGVEPPFWCLFKALCY